MRLSEFAGKEIINIFDGARLGTVSESDLIIDGDTGTVESIVVPGRFPFFTWRGRQNFLVIPWHAVRKIGEQIIVVDLELGGRRKLNS
ncbi:MAG TPA: YlmC/YmxH family sporulation protein [Clostridia bacterium]|nr:YlmC/YmxH family sporulation protein [Clostridia bacterium]